MSDYTKVSNSGSAIGEAVGVCMEKALENLLRNIADRYQYHYLTSGAKLTQSGKKAKKLLMSDNFGNQYNIDGIIANQY